MSNRSARLIPTQLEHLLPSVPFALQNVCSKVVEQIATTIQSAKQPRGGNPFSENKALDTGTSLNTN